MKAKEARGLVFAMPMTQPAYPPGPYRFFDREYLIITYRTDPDKLRTLVPSPLETDEPIVKFEFIRTPDSSGFGCYTEVEQVIPVSFEGRKGEYTHCMFVNDHPPIVDGQELWEFPNKRAQPSLRAQFGVLVGSLEYGPVRVATGAMGYKHCGADAVAAMSALSRSNYLLKIIRHADGSPRICELVEYPLKNVRIKGVRTGPGALSLTPHALAPVAELPVLDVISAVHLVCDLTVGLGKVVHDYLI